MLGIKTLNLSARMGEDELPVYAIPPEGFQRFEAEDKVWKLEARLCGLHLSPAWVAQYCLSISITLGFVSRPADPCVCSIENESIIFLTWVGDTLMSGSDGVKIEQLINKPKNRF